MAISVGEAASLPSVYAAHRLGDGRWEIVAHDDDPRRPPWRRWTVTSGQKATSRGRPIAAGKRTACHANDLKRTFN
jgi:hypothetical protein